jgi:hypothetical protein
MRTGIGQHCGNCRRRGAAAFAEPSHVVQRAIVTALKQQCASTPICCEKNTFGGGARVALRRLRGVDRMVAIATTLGTVLVAR